MDWKASKIGTLLYNVRAVMPTTSEGALIYEFETDYANKSIKPLNELGKQVYESLLAEPKKPVIKKQTRKTKRPGRKSRRRHARKKKRTQQLSKEKTRKTAPKKVEEYEYVVSDEEESGGGFLLPGVPMPGGN